MFTQKRAALKGNAITICEDFRPPNFYNLPVELHSCDRSSAVRLSTCIFVMV